MEDKMKTFSSLDIANKIQEASDLSDNRKAELNVSWFYSEFKQQNAEYEASLACCLSEVFIFDDIVSLLLEVPKWKLESWSREVIQKNTTK